MLFLRTFIKKGKMSSLTGFLLYSIVIFLKAGYVLVLRNLSIKLYLCRQIPEMRLLTTDTRIIARPLQHNIISGDFYSLYLTSVDIATFSLEASAFSWNPLQTALFVNTDPYPKTNRFNIFKMHRWRSRQEDFSKYNSYIVLQPKVSLKTISHGIVGSTFCEGSPFHFFALRFSLYRILSLIQHIYR